MLFRSNYSGLIPYVIEAAKEQQKKIEALEEKAVQKEGRIASLEKALAAQKEGIEALKKQMMALLLQSKK